MILTTAQLRRFIPRLLLAPLLLVPCLSAQVIQFSISIGPTNIPAFGTIGQAVAADGNGYTYTAGGTGLSYTYPADPDGSADVFVAKLDPAGNIVWNVSFGGTGTEWATGMAVDKNSNVWVTGVTYSANFPVKNSLQPYKGGAACTGNVQTGCSDAFVVELDPSGNILYATLLGGTGDDQATGIALDAGGNIFVTGSTTSTDFPLENPLQTNPGGAGDAFVSEINAAGTALVWSTYLGGSGADQANGIALDSSANVYIAGQTSSTDFPVKNPLQPANAGGQDGFIAKINPAGTALVYSTYLGGSQSDYASGIAVDSAGSAYVAFNAGGANFPITKLISHVFLGPQNLVAVKLNAAGSAIDYSVSVIQTTNAGGIAVDPSGNASLTGTFVSQVGRGGPNSYLGVLATVNAAGTALNYLNQNPAGGVAVATDAAGSVVAAGHWGVIAGESALVTRINASALASCTYTATISNQVVSAAGGGVSAQVNTSAPGCVPSFSTDSDWLLFGGIGTGNSSSTVVLTFTALQATVSRTGTITIGGQTFTITQGPSAPVSVSPASGGGSQQVFTATYTNPASLGLVYIMVSAAVQPSSSCFALYDVGLGQFRLIGDDGSSASAVAPGSGIASNSQCTLNGVGAAATVTGGNLVVSFPLTFRAGYAGTKSVFLFALSSGGSNSGWQTMGNWTVSSAGVPQPLSINPSNGSATSGTFTGTFTHGGGGSQHYLEYLLFLPTPNIVSYTAQGSCLMEYNIISKGMRLVNDAGTDWLPAGIPQGVTTGTLSNSVCSLNIGNSSAQLSGSTLTVNYAVTFNSGFTGTLGTFLQELDVKGQWAGVTQFGNWTAFSGSAKPGPSATPVTPTAGSGSTATFTGTFRHSAGLRNIYFATLLVSSSIVGSPACQLIYFGGFGNILIINNGPGSSDTLNLINDAGTGFVSNGVTQGTTFSPLSNSRCSLTAGSVTQVDANTATLSVTMNFTAAAFAGPKNVYFQAFDTQGLATEWVGGATWTVQ